MTTSLKLRRGTTVQHAAFTGAEGEVTVDTTKNTVVVHDGTTEGGFPLAKEKFLQTGTGAVARTVDQKLKDSVSVKDFGAKGDGISDDTAAFQSAIDFANSVGGGDVDVSDGEYLTTTKITVKQNVVLRLSSGVKVLHNSASDSIFEMQKNSGVIGASSLVKATNTSWNGKAVTIDGAQQIDFLNSIKIDSIVLQAVNATLGQTTSGSVGLYMFANGNQHYISGVRVSNCAFVGFEKAVVLDSIVGSGVVGNSSTWRWVNGNVFDNCFIYNCDYGFKLLGSAGVPHAVDGNIITNLVVQVYTGTVEQVIEIQGNDNIVDMYVWDFPSGLKIPIVLGTGTSNNSLRSNIAIPAISGESTANRIRRFENIFNNVYAESSVRSEVVASSTVGVQSTILAADGSKSKLETSGSGELQVNVAGVQVQRMNSGGWTRFGPENIANGSATFGTVRVPSNGDAVVAHTGAGTNAGSVFNGNRNSAGSLAYFTVNNGTTYVGQITTNLTTTSYSTASDYRLKKDVAPLSGGLDVTLKLNPVTWSWKSSGTVGQGFLAHELQAHVPECVTGEKDAMRSLGNVLDADGNVIYSNVDEPEVLEPGQVWVHTTDVPAYQGVDTSFLVATLVNAVQELNAKLEAMKTEIAGMRV